MADTYTRVHENWNNNDATTAVDEAAMDHIEAGIAGAYTKAPTLHAASHVAGGTDALALNASQLTAGTLNLERAPAGSVVYMIKTAAGVWPGGTASTATRPTARADIVVIWKGAAPFPPIVSTGTGGMRDGIDEQKIPVT